jgi:hypothetical protein
MPPPPVPLIPHWRQQVRNFIEDHLQRTVEEVQPCLFGLGFYHMRSPAARAALVDHIPYQMQQGVFVRFVNHDDRENHRAVQGFRRGWLMFLSIPLDFRNDYDLANAVSTFGKLLHWHQDDVLLERTICYVAFPSDAKVPRDVVFNKFATVGGVKESWTAACFILTAEFADELPHDEDQMPLNGNPHPLPGQLVPNLNIFVNPEFPEIGWDEQEQMQANDNGQGVQHPLFPPEQVQDQVMEVDEEPLHQHQEADPEQQVVQESHQFNVSAIINSSSSEGSVNMLPGPHQLVINRMEVQFQVLGKDLTDFLDRIFPAYTSYLPGYTIGPVLPKDMFLDKIYKGLVPALTLNTIPSVLPTHKFAWIVRCMPPVPELALSKGKITDVVGKVVAKRRKSIIPPTTRITRSALKVKVQNQKQSSKKGSRVSFEAATSLFTDKTDSSSWNDSSVRRCTRHMAKTDGYKLESMQDKSSIRKKPKVSKPADDEREEVAPFIPIPILQQIGRQLEISDEDLTRDKLMAAPQDPKKNKASNED